MNTENGKKTIVIKPNVIILDILVCLLVMLLTPVMTANSGSDESSRQEAYGEFEVKAVMVERIVRFFEWPESSGIEDSSLPFVIGVMGKTPLENQLEKVYESKKIREKKVKFRFIENIEEIAGCHILFIASDARPMLSRILNFVKEKPILTMSDTPGFCERGVHINFVLVPINNKGASVRFEINETSVKVSGLGVTWHLFDAAKKIVQPLK